MRAGNQKRLKRRIDRLRRSRHRGALSEKWKESLQSVLPITVIVIALGLLAVPTPSGAMLAFLAGAVLLVVGMGLFTLGTDLAMTPIGEHVGAAMTRSKKLWVVLLCSFLVGVIVTVSEPDLQVLARQVPAVPDRVIILTKRPATVARIVPISFNLEHDTPLIRRNAPEFKTYFNEIWEELNHNGQITEKAL